MIFFLPINSFFYIYIYLKYDWRGESYLWIRYVTLDVHTFDEVEARINTVNDFPTVCI